MAKRVIEIAQSLEAMEVSLSNLKELIDWLGDDFYAFTAGYPVVINNALVSYTGAGEDIDLRSLDLAERMVLVLRDPNGVFLVAGQGDVLVHYPGVGYRCMTKEDYETNYTEQPTESEPEFHCDGDACDITDMVDKEEGEA